MIEAALFRLRSNLYNPRLCHVLLYKHQQSANLDMTINWFSSYDKKVICLWLDEKDASEFLLNHDT